MNPPYRDDMKNVVLFESYKAFITKATSLSEALFINWDIKKECQIKNYTVMKNDKLHKR